MTEDWSLDAFVARQPIFNARREAHGYELLFRSGVANQFEHPDGDQASARVIANSVLLMGMEKMTGGRPAFINFTRDTLVQGYATLLPRDRVVVEILEDVAPDAEVIAACRQLKQKGYVLALDDFVCSDLANPLLDLADIVKVDFLATSPAEREQVARALKGRVPALLAEKLEDRAAFDEAAALGYRYFQGYFLSRPVIVAEKDVPGFKLHYLKLLREVNRPELDFDAFADVLAQDAALTYKLLRYINSPYFGTRREIASIPQALGLLGESAVKKWTSVVALAGIASDQPLELAVTSLVRARFCEALAPEAGVEPRARDLFMLGLFSQLDALMGRPLPELLRELTIPNDVKHALLGGENRLRNVFECAVSYERARWPEMARSAERLDLAEPVVPPVYGEAVQWARETLSR